MNTPPPLNREYNGDPTGKALKCRGSTSCQEKRMAVFWGHIGVPVFTVWKLTV